MEVKKLDNRQKIKRQILKTAIFLLLALIVFTFFSKSVRLSMLPRVRFVEAWADTLRRSMYIYDFQITELGTQSVIAGGDWQIEEVFVKEGDAVEEGSVLFTINIDQQRSELLRLLSAAESIDLSLANPSLDADTRRIMELNSAAAWRDYRTLRDSFPSTGEVLASAGGTITSLNVETYMKVSRGATLAEFANTESTEVIEFRLTAEEQSVYGTIEELEIFLSNAGKREITERPVMNVEKDGDEYVWHVESPGGLSETYSVQYLLLEDISITYQSVLPNDCIQYSMASGDYIYIVNESKPGVNTVDRMSVEVLEAGLVNSAIDRVIPNVKVISYASKSLAQDDEIVVLYDE